MNVSIFLFMVEGGNMADFFDKVKGDMDKYFEAIGLKAGELADTARIRMEIHYLNKEKEKELISLGSAVYKMYLKNKFDEKKIIEKCTPIDDLEEEIRITRYEMKDINKYGKKSHRKHRRKKKRKNKEKEVEAENYSIVPID